MITLKQLKEHFSLFTRDRGKTQLLYSLTERGDYTPDKYLCHIIKVAPGYYALPEFEHTNKIDVLLEDVKKHLVSLKYNSEFYNPYYIDGYFEHMCVTEYMRSIGFESTGQSNYILKRKNIYGGDREKICIYVSGLEIEYGGKELSKTIDIVLWRGDSSWVSVKNIKRHPDYIIPEIDALLKPLFLVNSADDFKKSEELTFKNIDVVMEQLLGDYSIGTQNVKDQLIKSLEETLEKLKA
jgi:hypothetical protein